MEKTGEYRKAREVQSDQKNGKPPEKKGAGAEQYASQEETSILHSPIKQQQYTGMTSITLHHSLHNIASFAHLTTPSANTSSSPFVFPLCKHTRTRSFPLGTVGHVIARTFIPRPTRYADSGRGYGVSIGIIGDDNVS